MILISELDVNGYFMSDYPYEGGSIPMPDYTFSRPPQGMYRAKYLGTRKATGEWVNGTWLDDVENHTGKTIWNTTTKESKIVTEVGPIPNGWTEMEPREFDYWDGSLWITDLVLRNKVLKQRKIDSINLAFENAMQAVRWEYTESEIMSWYKQEGEARYWLKDNTYPTPLVDLIAEARGLEKSDLINKIIIKADQYAIATGIAVGRRQACEDQIKAITIGNEAQLDQIQF